MTSNKIFNKIQLGRDFTGSEADIYAQLLQTMLFELTAQGKEKEFFKLLHEAEKANKQLTIKKPFEPVHTGSEIFIDNIAIM